MQEGFTVRHNAAKTAGISKAFLRLKKIQPQVYDEAVRDFERYAWEVTAAVTDAAPDQVLLAQGMARQCNAILRALRECELIERQQPPGS
jgi:hypothetical protein